MEHCPNCGRFIESDPQGYFDRLDRSDEFGAIVAFCDEQCSRQYHVKQLRDEPRPLSHYN